MSLTVKPSARRESQTEMKPAPKPRQKREARKRNWYQQGKKPIPESRLLQVLNNLGEREYDQGTRAELIECCGYLQEQNSELCQKYAHLKSGMTVMWFHSLNALMKVKKEADDLFKPKTKKP